MTDDFFSIPEGVVERSDGGSPRLVPRGVDPASGIRADYTRASYMSGFIEESEHFHRWEMRYLAKAMGQNEDLAALAACETYSTGVTDATYGRVKTNSGRRLDEIIERALDRVRIHEKADRGTAVHGFTEPGCPTGDAVPERLRAVVASFWETVRVNAIWLAATEQFTANDDVMSAGTFDHLIRVPGHPLFEDRFVIADKKTGRYSPFEWTVQLAIYAYGDPYNLANHTRPEWPGEVDREWGLVLWMDAEKGTTKPIPVDLKFGWEMAQLAAQVRDGHERRDLTAPFKPATFDQKLNASNDRGALERLWYSTTDEAEKARVNEKARTL